MDERGEARGAGGSGLSGRQRQRLRGLAHGLEPIVHVGSSGLSPGVVAEVVKALEAHELVKVRLHDPEDKRGAAAALAAACGAELCGLLGHTVILYRRHPDTPRIAVEPR